MPVISALRGCESVIAPEDGITWAPAPRPGGRRRRPATARCVLPPERLDRASRAHPARPRGTGPAALADLRQGAAQVDLPGRHEHDRPAPKRSNTSCQCRLSNSVSIRWKRCRSASSGAIGRQVVHHALGLGEDRPQPLDRGRRVVGDHEVALRGDPLEPALERGAPDAVGDDLPASRRANTASSCRARASSSGCASAVRSHSSRVSASANAPLVCVRSASQASGRTRSSPTTARSAPKSK